MSFETQRISTFSLFFVSESLVHIIKTFSSSCVPACPRNHGNGTHIAAKDARLRQGLFTQEASGANGSGGHDVMTFSSWTKPEDAGGGGAAFTRQTGISCIWFG